MTGSDWLTDFAARLGVEAPSAEVVSALLELAGVAAHASERTAAPIACFLVAKAGIDVEKALQVARAIAPEAK